MYTVPRIPRAESRRWKQCSPSPPCPIKIVSWRRPSPCKQAHATWSPPPTNYPTSYAPKDSAAGSMSPCGPYPTIPSLSSIDSANLQKATPLTTLFSTSLARSATLQAPLCSIIPHSSDASMRCAIQLIQNPPFASTTSYMACTLLLSRQPPSHSFGPACGVGVSLLSESPAK